MFWFFDQKLIVSDNFHFGSFSRGTWLQSHPFKEHLTSASEPEKHWTYRSSCCITPNAPPVTAVRALLVVSFLTPRLHLDLLPVSFRNHPVLL
jgi:hypothetical protein